MMSQQLSKSNILALGFMTFALFLGAGNIIFPVAAGLQSGSLLWLVAAGFLLTGVGLPLATVVVLARVGGGMPALTAPMGKLAGTVFSIIIYLAIGPFFATPRTAVVAYEIGLAPLVGDKGWWLFLSTGLYFTLVLYLAMNPGRLLARVGQVLTPILLLALMVLALSAMLFPVDSLGQAREPYASQSLSQGMLDGYLTMDAFGAMVFGIVIAGAIRGLGVTDAAQITRYSTYAGLIAALGLSLVYLSLFYLGGISQSIAEGASNGGQVLAIYVQQAFGNWGILLLAIVITLACLTTATGLLSACGEYFEQLWGIGYQKTVVVFTLLSWLVSNQGLTQLIKVSIPALGLLYPLAIVLVVLSFLRGVWKNPDRIFKLTLLVTLMFSVLDALQAAGISWGWMRLLQYLPLAQNNLAWLVPVVLTVLLLSVLERLTQRCAASSK